MSSEFHTPSKWSVAIVFLVIIAMMGGVFAWAFYFNRGKIIVRADKGFTLEVNGETIDCSATTCKVSLAPQEYEFKLSSEGYYDELFTLEVIRWQEFTKELKLTLIPFLQDIKSRDIPPDDQSVVFFKKGADSKLLLMRREGDSENLVSTFESLKKPTAQIAGNMAVVVDEGKAYFVNLEDGRKLRRFDDTVYIYDARLSDDGKRVLMFVKMDEVDQIWVWFNETNNLTPLTWYAPPEFVQWEIGVEHRFYVITDQLNVEETPSIFDDFLEDSETDINGLALYNYNMDTDRAVLISDFSDKDLQGLTRVGDRYFVQYAGTEFQELVVR